MEPKYCKYQFCVHLSGVLGVRLNQLLEQEGQPCSYCIAVFLLIQNGEVLTRNDNLAYRYHLAADHGIKPYAIEA